MKYINDEDIGGDVETIDMIDEVCKWWKQLQ